MAKRHKKTQKARNAFMLIGAVILIIVLLGFYFSLKQNVLATVNGQPITQMRIDALYNSLPNGTTLTKEKILSQVIDTMILADYAEKNGYALSDDDFNISLNQRLITSNITLDELQKELSLHGATLGDVRDNLVIEAFVKAEITPNIKLSNSEIKAYQAQYPQYSQTQIAASLFRDYRAKAVQTIIDAHRSEMDIVIK